MFYIWVATQLFSDDLKDLSFKDNWYPVNTFCNLNNFLQAVEAMLFQLNYFSIWKFWGTFSIHFSNFLTGLCDTKPLQNFKKQSLAWIQFELCNQVFILLEFNCCLCHKISCYRFNWAKTKVPCSSICIFSHSELEHFLW